MMRLGINCLDVDPSFVGGVTTYTAGLLEGFIKVGEGTRFKIFATKGNQGFFERFRNHPQLEIVVVNGSFPIMTKVSRAALLTYSRGVFKNVNDLVFRKIRDAMDAESDVL